MTRSDKLLETARNNPAGLRFDDFQTLLNRLGWTLDRQPQVAYSAPEGKRNLSGRGGHSMIATHKKTPPKRQGFDVC